MTHSLPIKKINKREPIDGYWVMQGGLPELEVYLKQIHV